MAAAARKGKCRYGKKCRDIRKCSFEHECFFARTEAGCRYGDDCLLLHPTAQNAYRFEKGEEFLFDANKTGLLACAADDSELIAPGFDINEATPEQLSALQRRLDARFQIAIKAIEAAHRVALCFVLDTTGSMKDQIRGVKDQILDIATTLKAEGCDLRSLAFVGYKVDSRSYHACMPPKFVIFWFMLKHVEAASLREEPLFVRSRWECFVLVSFAPSSPPTQDWSDGDDHFEVCISLSALDFHLMIICYSMYLFIFGPCCSRRSASVSVAMIVLASAPSHPSHRFSTSRPRSTNSRRLSATSVPAAAATFQKTCLEGCCV
jgi:hypothetical protein